MPFVTRGWAALSVLPGALTALLLAGGCTGTANQGAPSKEDLHNKLTAIVQAQSKALLAGDRNGFVGAAKQPGARDQLSLRYHNMTAMRVTTARVKISIPQEDTEPGWWKAEITFELCFVTKCAREETVTEQTQWSVGADGPELMSIMPSTDGGPRPWQATELAVAHDDRLMVAVAKPLADRLPQVLDAAKAAVPVADSFSPREKLDGSLPADEAPDAEGLEQLRRYQIAFLAVKCLDTNYGRQSLLSFFDKVVKENFSYENSSLSAFGNKPWATVEAECVSFVRNG